MASCAFTRPRSVSVGAERRHVSADQQTQTLHHRLRHREPGGPTGAGVPGQGHVQPPAVGAGRLPARVPDR